MVLRERAANDKAAMVVAKLSDDIATTVAREVATMTQVARAVPELSPDPAVIDTRLDTIEASSKQSFFDDLLIVASLGPNSVTGLDLAVRVAHDQDGSGLRFTGLSAGDRVSALLEAAGLTALPQPTARPRLLWMRGEALTPEVVGAIETGQAHVVIADTFPVVAVPVPRRGWVLGIVKPSGIDTAVARLPHGATIAAWLHSGVGEAGPLLAERRAIQPPPSADVRRHARSIPILDQQLTVVVGVDRFLGTAPGFPPGVALVLGLFATLLASAAASARTQRIARQTMQRELDHEKFLARTDPLTGLGNRLAFNEAMDAALSDQRHSPLPVAVLLCDLDRFKVVNDARGHEVGDQLLRDVATRMNNAAIDLRNDVGVRSSEAAGTDDTGCGRVDVYRFGGDEFVIALTGSSASAAVDFAYGLVSSIRKPFRVGVDQVVIGVSVGLAASGGSNDVSNRSSLLRDADMAMYVAKRGGGNRVAVADDEVRVAGATQLDVEIELRRALGSGQLRAWYQPLVDRRRNVVALEALIRWEHPTRGLLSPGLFLPAAKTAGLLAELSTAVLSEAARDVSDWNRLRSEAGLAPLVVHVNCVEEQLMDTGFADVVGSYLVDTGLDPHSLLLEISEETALDRLPASLPTLDLLRRSGVRFSIDDFGFGNSSLTMVRRVGEVAELKIDKSIVDGLALASPLATDLAVVRSIVDFGRTQKITIVAEGIEEEHQFSQLVGLGVDLFQGYLFHRPQPAHQLHALLAPIGASSIPAHR